MGDRGPIETGLRDGRSPYWNEKNTFNNQKERIISLENNDEK